MARIPGKQGRSRNGCKRTAPIFHLSATRGRLVVALANLRVDAPLELGAGIVLVPVKAVPQAKERLTGRLGSLGAHSALIRRFLGLPRTWKGAAPAGALLRSAEDFEYTALALTLIGPCAVAVAGTWSELDPDIPFSRGSFFGGSYNLLEPSLPSFQPDEIAGLRLRALAQKTVALVLQKPAAERRRLRLPLDRLSLSGRRGRAGDKYVDLAVAIEALLSHKSDPMTEIGYRLRTRAARLLGGTQEERRATTDAVKAIYKARSEFLHSGKEPTAKQVADIAKVQQALADHRSLVSRLISTVLENGMPDWPSFDIQN